jgi:hypothetical protein
LSGFFVLSVFFQEEKGRVDESSGFCYYAVEAIGE